MNASLAIAIVNFCALPWASTSMTGTLPCMAVWGFVGWGVIVPQQHRLVKMGPEVAPLLLALNNTATSARFEALQLPKPTSCTPSPLSKAPARL